MGLAGVIGDACDKVAEIGKEGRWQGFVQKIYYINNL